MTRHRHKGTDRVRVTYRIPVDGTGDRAGVVGDDSDPNASLVETDGEGGQAAVAAGTGR